MIFMERQMRSRDSNEGQGRVFRGRDGDEGRGDRRSFRPRAPRKPAKVQQKKERAKFDVKLFNRWDNNVEVQDASLRGYINLEPRILPRSAGIQRGRFHKSKMHIVERLALGHPKILILDDITSALDGTTEALVWQELTEKLPKVTCFIIVWRR